MPDLAGWRRDRMAEPPEAAAIELAPDWICEVLSPEFDVSEWWAVQPAPATPAAP